LGAWAGKGQSVGEPAGRPGYLRQHPLPDSQGRRWSGGGRGHRGRGRPWFWLVQDGAVSPGVAWWRCVDGQRKYQHKVVSRGAAIYGVTGPLLVGEIGDANGDDVFDPNWTRPDRWWDVHFTGYGIHTLRTSQNGGHSRSGPLRLRPLSRRGGACVAHKPRHPRYTRTSMLPPFPAA
jgi:hypothetical protein